MQASLVSSVIVLVFVFEKQSQARLRLIPQMPVRSLPGIGWKKGRILKELEPPLEVRSFSFDHKSALCGDDVKSTRCSID